MIFAYADPPYPGCAHRYPEKREVNHRVLIDDLSANYRDGWALSTNSTSLRAVLALCPPDVRIGAWVKSFASFKPGVNPAYAWEPVIFSGGRRRDRYDPTVRDWYEHPITMKKGLVGAKPEGFCRWVLDLLGYEDGDGIVDLYPGTGVMARVASQLSLSYRAGGSTRPDGGSET